MVNKLLSLPRPDIITHRQGCVTRRLGKVTRVHLTLLKQLVHRLERDRRIELLTRAWKARVIPFYESRFETLIPVSQMWLTL